MLLFILRTRGTEAERGTQFPLLALSLDLCLEGFSNARHIVKTSEADDRPGESTSKCSSHWITLLRPSLTHAATGRWSSELPDM